MSRLNTQSDIDQTPTNLKLNMINNNINRIYMQNQRLQQLIEHREQIDRLKDVVEVSNQNWKKLAVLAQNVQEMHQSAIGVKNKIRGCLGEYTQHINKQIVSEIQNNKIAVASHEGKLKDIKLRHSNKIKKDMQQIKKKGNDRIAKIKAESSKLIKKAEQEYSQVVQEQVCEISEEFQIQVKRRQNECRINLGHLQNLIGYYYHQKHGEMIDDVSLSSMVGSNFVTIRKKVQNLQLKQKKIKSQIDWIKSRARKDKNHHKKAKQTPFEPQQYNTIDELELGLNDSEYQLKGLDIICQELSQKLQKQLNKEQIGTLIEIKERLKNLALRGKQYSSFYQQYF